MFYINAYIDKSAITRYGDHPNKQVPLIQDFLLMNSFDNIHGA